MADKLVDLISKEMTPYVIDKQKYQPQDDIRRYEKVQKKADAKQKELLMRKEQYMTDKLEDLILEDIIVKQKYQPQDDTTTRDRKDEPGTEKYQPQDDTTTRDRKDEPGTEIPGSQPRQGGRKGGQETTNGEDYGS